jgi:hypothetical protein
VQTLIESLNPSPPVAKLIADSVKLLKAAFKPTSISSSQYDPMIQMYWSEDRPSLRQMAEFFKKNGWSDEFEGSKSRKLSKDGVTLDIQLPSFDGPSIDIEFIEQGAD